MRKLQLSRKVCGGLNAGERLKLSGVIYTARDQAHCRLAKAIRAGRKTPIDLREKIIYYCGPAKAPKGRVIGSCGPTTSSRMDEFTPLLLKAGILGMIGKGGRSPGVVRAIKRNKGIYFLTFAGCGALLAKYVRSATPVAYKDLGPEAIYRLEVRDFPLIVGVDSKGKRII
ncbi:MAG: fumarate hydratase C-terminal domain-containing protein [Candidatus Omnitrophica bacterium]|nr:fumarate hydratase C-terminal domain-containing protein [Candidatus Omnitrophota bacterium]